MDIVELTRIAACFGVVSFLVVLPAGELAAQEGQCGVILTECSGGSEAYHNFVEDEPENEEFEDRGYHGECLVCSSGGQEKNATVCHPSCGGGGATEEDEQQQLASLHFLELAADGAPLERLIEAAAVAERVQVNTTRRSLQMIDCRGEVVANLPLGDLYPTAVLQLMNESAAEVQ